MGNLIGRWVLFGLFLGLAAFSLAAASLPQADPQTGLIAKRKRGYSMPISERTVQLKVVVPPADYVSTITVKEGEMAKVYAPKAGFAYALVPLVCGNNNDAAEVTIFRLTQDKEGNESLQELERVSVTLDRQVSVQSDPSLKIQLMGIVSHRGGPAARNSPLAGSP